ncbi:MAG: hypothetical protein ABJX32_21165 [Tateyamaria sp.]|uniref:hypothetical protein n=1 Tax=Tateyamaria sp. TaxID=1929288 RepID=UPI00329C993C
MTHMKAVEEIAGDTGAERNYFGNLRGIDKYNGYAAALVIGKPTPPLRAAERGVEALFRDSVDRESRIQAEAHSGSYRRRSVAAAGLS